MPHFINGTELIWAAVHQHWLMLSHFLCWNVRLVRRTFLQLLFCFITANILTRLNEKLIQDTKKAKSLHFILNKDKKKKTLFDKILSLHRVCIGLQFLCLFSFFHMITPKQIPTIYKIIGDHVLSFPKLIIGISRNVPYANIFLGWW